MGSMVVWTSVSFHVFKLGPQGKPEISESVSFWWTWYIWLTDFKCIDSVEWGWNHACPMFGTECVLKIHDTFKWVLHSQCAIWVSQCFTKGPSIRVAVGLPSERPKWKVPPWRRMQKGTLHSWGAKWGWSSWELIKLCLQIVVKHIVYPQEMELSYPLVI